MIGWDFTANAPSHWIKRVSRACHTHICLDDAALFLMPTYGVYVCYMQVYEIYPSEWSDRPHYLLLVENAAPNSQIPEELYLAYVSEVCTHRWHRDRPKQVCCCNALCCCCPPSLHTSVRKI